MDTKSQRLKGRESAISALNAVIEAMDLAKGLSTITRVKDVFVSVSVTLTTLRVGSCWFVLIGYRLRCT